VNGSAGIVDMSTIEITPELEVRPGGVTSDTRGPSGTRPSARRYVPYLIFALCASLYFFPFMRLILRGSDEGILVEGAVRTVHGQLLGRDFLEVVGPGTFYWLALFFKMFGVTFLASRICLFISSLGTALSIYFLSRRVCRSYQLLPCALVFSTYFATFWPEISHHVDSNFFALLAVVCMVLWQDLRKNWLLLAAGALAGATTLILQPKGILLLLAFFVWLWIQHRKRLAALYALVWVAGGCLGVVAAMLGYFWTQGALGDLIYINVVWPSHNYGPTFTVPYAFLMFEYFKHWVVPMHGINWTVGMAAILFFPFLFVAALPVLVLCLGIGHGIRNMRPEIVLYWLAGSAFWFSEIHRKDIAHLVFGCPLLVLLCIFYLQERRSKSFSLVLQILSITSVCLVSAALFVTLVAPSMTTRVGQVHIAAYDPVLAKIEERVPRGQDIFIYPYAPMYYFLSATTNPTRFSTVCFNFKIGSQFQLDEIVRDLDQRKVKYVLWDKSLEGKLAEVLFPSEHTKQFIIAPYFDSHYKPIWTHDGTLLMERKSGDHGN
jgi:4-amino-4-deoxy-L-arabinose transferase-like glycosyltransferase